MDPMAELGGKYRIVAMDQCNAGRSSTRIDATDDWHTYAGDQLALADHIGLDRFHVIGGRVGASSFRLFVWVPPPPGTPAGGPEPPPDYATRPDFATFVA